MPTEPAQAPETDGETAAAETILDVLDALAPEQVGGAGPAPSPTASEFRIAKPDFEKMRTKHPHWLKRGQDVGEKELQAMMLYERGTTWIRLMNAIVLGRAYAARIAADLPTDGFEKQACGYEKRRVKEFRTVAEALDGTLPMLDSAGQPVAGKFVELNNERTAEGVGFPPELWLREEWGIEAAVDEVRRLRKVVDVQPLPPDGQPAPAIVTPPPAPAAANAAGEAAEAVETGNTAGEADEEDGEGFVAIAAAATSLARLCGGLADRARRPLTPERIVALRSAVRLAEDALLSVKATLQEAEARAAAGEPQP